MRLLAEIISIADGVCWIACFWWMRRISRRQDALLAELKEQGGRIEDISKEERKILAEVHPSVQKIEKDLGTVSEKVEPVVRPR